MPRGMNTMTIELGVNVDKYEVAIAALNGAVSVMVAAGLNDTEIAALFLRAASSSAEDAAETHPSEWEGDSDEETTSIYEIEANFERTTIYKSLSRLSKRAEPLSDQDTVAACGKIEKLIVEAVPLMKAAADWYESACADCGIKFEISRKAWLETASDADLDAEEEYLFYDSSSAAHVFAPWIISDYARRAENLGRINEIENIQDAIIQNELLLEQEVLIELAQALQNASYRVVVQSIVEALESGFEMPQAEFIRSIAASSENKAPEHLLESWIYSFEESGLLERYKRSNRWQIRRV